MSSQTSSSARVEKAISGSVDFELTLADITLRSERRAWWVAGIATVMASILAGGYFYMLPLKQKVPYLVMADAYSGTATVVGMSQAAIENITAHEAINRSNVAHFVLARESYDVTMMKLQDWVTVLTMSSPGVAAAYKAVYSPNNENNPYSVYGKERAIRVNIRSIVLLGNVPGRTPTGATVRFQRAVYDKTSGSSQPLDSKIATLAFTYKPNLQMDERYRIANPLGFQVSDYRVSTDYESTPPEAVQADAVGDPAGKRRIHDPLAETALPSDEAPTAAGPATPHTDRQPPIPVPRGATRPTPQDPTYGAGQR